MGWVVSRFGSWRMADGGWQLAGHGRGGRLADAAGYRLQRLARVHADMDMGVSVL